MTSQQQNGTIPITSASSPSSKSKTVVITHGSLSGEPQKNEEVTVESIPYIMPSYMQMPPPLTIPESEVTVKKGLLVLHHKSNWFEIGPFSSVSISIYPLPFVGLVSYCVHCEDYLGALTHYVGKTTTEPVTNITISRIIIINSASAARKVMISWL